MGSFFFVYFFARYKLLFSPGSARGCLWSTNASVTTSVTAGTYRAKAVYRVSCNGSTETITVYSSSVTFS